MLPKAGLIAMFPKRRPMPPFRTTGLPVQRSIAFASSRGRRRAGDVSPSVHGFERHRMRRYPKSQRPEPYRLISDRQTATGEYGRTSGVTRVSGFSAVLPRWRWMDLTSRPTR